MNIFDLIGTVVVNVIKSITTVINLITDSVKKGLKNITTRPLKPMKTDHPVPETGQQVLILKNEKASFLRLPRRI